VSYEYDAIIKSIQTAGRGKQEYEEWVAALKPQIAAINAARERFNAERETLEKEYLEIKKLGKVPVGFAAKAQRLRTHGERIVAEQEPAHAPRKKENGSRDARS
jgi:hypothetical protein